MSFRAGRTQRLVCCGWKAIAVLCLLWAGCGPSAEERLRESKGSSIATAAGQTETQPQQQPRFAKGTLVPDRSAPAYLPDLGSGADPAVDGSRNSRSPAATVRHLTQAWRPPRLDDTRMQQAGLRKSSSKHLTLYTDLPNSPPVAELPAAFDAAVPQWCAYFEVREDLTADWHMTAYVMRDKQRFRAAGVLPDDLPPFLHGYQRFAEIWIHEQPSDYYRRHLLLHEGTHAFMQWALGSAGPPWYMEGTAELLSTHRWQDRRLTLRHFPQNRDEVPHWGRIKIIKDDIAADRGKSLEDVLNYDASAHRQVEPYAWCWAVAALFDAHPLSRDTFRNLRRYTNHPAAKFSAQFYHDLELEWPQLSRQWQLFICNLDYGYSLSAELVELRAVQALPEGGARVTVAANRGWQSSGIRLEAGKKYSIEASGRFQLAREPKPWWCEPNGVTIRYFHGFPLGLLLGALVDEERDPAELTPLVRPDPIGLGRESAPDRTGTLYLRINDSPAELADNQGEATVFIRQLLEK